MDKLKDTGSYNVLPVKTPLSEPDSELSPQKQHLARSDSSGLKKLFSQDVIPLPTTGLSALVATCVVVAVGTGFGVSSFNMSVVKTQKNLGINMALGGTGDIRLLLFPLLGGTIVGALQFISDSIGLPSTVKDLGALRARQGYRQGFFGRETARLVLHLAQGVAAVGFANSVGPTIFRIQIGTHLAAMFSSLMGVSQLQSDLLLGAGVAGGIAAGAHAPLAAVACGLEMVWPKQEAWPLQATMMALVASLAVATSLRALTVTQVLESLVLNEDHSDMPLELCMFFSLGLLCGCWAWLFKNFFRPVFQGWWQRAQAAGVPRCVHPALAGLATGLTAWAGAHEVMFLGWANFKHVLLNPTSISASKLIMLCPLKLCLTAFSLTSSMPGGLFAPSMFAGAAAGGAFSHMIAEPFSMLLLGGKASHPRVYTTVGMASMLATVAGVPCTAACLLLEITRNHDLVPPIMCGIGAATFANHVLDSIDPKQKVSVK
eukprot:TRINITY_DN101394_c0_g1_i1.p1 TRINITY_DN101394_c0_g1~~TRINITY_DN101394_c0_g1_i1.p1  ORF type:complete len:488 (+),score=89.28 TRINITY_DN101394_c0_g1_i1:95-1558(+)